MDQRETSIAVNVGAKVATDLAIAHYNMEGSAGDQTLGSLFESYLPEVVEVLVKLHEQSAVPVATASVVAAFPGSVVTSGPQENTTVAPNSAPTTGSVSAPAPIPGATTGDELWRELIQSPGNWFDNRQGKQNPKAPDFRHKTKLGPDGRYKVGLWLDKAPTWVKQHFGLAA